MLHDAIACELRTHDSRIGLARFYFCTGGKPCRETARIWSIRSGCAAENVALRPVPEMLEGRLLLYSKLGDQFVYSSRITYSFMPDGTSVGGVPSALFSTLNAKYPTAAWEQQIEQAASIWENAANLNLARVSDGGEAVG